MQHPFHPPRIEPVQNKIYAAAQAGVAVLRLDVMHPVISGNKWFKLKAYLQEAAQQQKKAILTFGGAYSNHIVATAAASAAAGLAYGGVIRGESPKVLSPTLLEAQQFGMQLFFTSRTEYKSKTIPPAVYDVFKKPDVYVIPEGGYGFKGSDGSMDILKSCDTRSYTHIVAAVGTGTMLSGLIRAAAPGQQVIGISVLKNNISVETEIRALTGNTATPYVILHDFHFGGYAKQTPELLQFMNQWYAQTLITTDFVYTGKTFFAADRLLRTNLFPPGSSVLFIHSGGLQGNRSLPAGALPYSHF
jgi:1-aminocyclopropane-1-carboxylate deaminase